MSEHAITVTPETLGDEPPPPDVGWRWLKQPEPADGTWYRPTCSCGWRSSSVYTAEDRARRAGVIHIAVNTPPDPSSERYLAQLEADIPTRTWTVHIWCRQHHDQPLATVPAPADEHQDEIREAIRDHDWQFHDDDRNA